MRSTHGMPDYVRVMSEFVSFCTLSLHRIFPNEITYSHFLLVAYQIPIQQI